MKNKVDKLMLRILKTFCIGCALRKITGGPVPRTCGIQGTQHMICIKKVRYSSRLGANVRPRALLAS